MQALFFLIPINICFSHCNKSHDYTVGMTKKVVEMFLPELFQPHLLCAGYSASSRGSCFGDSGGPLIAYNESLGQYFQVGIVSGGVSHCGNTDIPDYYVRLDHPEVAGFIIDPDNYKFGNF
jgi:secreted trypsin-like serine protease